MIVCDCDREFHKGCVGLNDEDSDEDWLCPVCIAEGKKKSIPTEDLQDKWKGMGAKRAARNAKKRKRDDESSNDE